MKSYRNTILIGLSVLIGVYIIARITGAFVPFITSTSANEPTFKLKNWVWVLFLKKK